MCAPDHPTIVGGRQRRSAPNARTILTYWAPAGQTKTVHEPGSPWTVRGRVGRAANGRAAYEADDFESSTLPSPPGIIVVNGLISEVNSIGKMYFVDGLAPIDLSASRY